MIASYRDPETQRLAEGHASNRFRFIAKAARRKLYQLHLAQRVSDLRIPPGNRLERLRGDREGQWSIRINDQWRLCFQWQDDSAYDVEIVDYP